MQCRHGPVGGPNGMGSRGTVLLWYVVLQGAQVLYAAAQTKQYIFLVDNRSGNLRGAAAAYNATSNGFTDLQPTAQGKQKNCDDSRCADTITVATGIPAIMHQGEPAEAL